MLLAVVDEGHDFLFEVVPLPDYEAPTLPLTDCEAPPLALPEPVLLLQVVLLCPIPLHTLHLIAIHFLDSLP